jgi:hypothetical protein
MGFNVQFRDKNKISIKGRPADAITADPKEMIDLLIAELKIPGAVFSFRKREPCICNGGSICNSLW